jgi:hypothetical protein
VFRTYKDGIYCPGDGPLHLVLPVFRNGELVDLCGFRPSDPLNWLLWVGAGWALGLEQGLEPLIWRSCVAVTASPFEWLQRGAEGSVCWIGRRRSFRISWQLQASLAHLRRSPGF